MLRDEKTIKILNETGIFKDASASELISCLEKIYKELILFANKPEMNSRIWKAKPGLYCARDEVFLKMQAAEDDSNRIITDETISARKRGTETELIARKNGYLVRADGKLSVFEPCRITDDNVHLYFIFFPVQSGKNLIKNDFFEALSKPTKDHGLRKFSEENVVEIINSREIRTETISLGLQPSPGRQERLKIAVTADKKPDKKADGCIDYYSYSMYREVEKGTILAEKITGIPGEPGLDAYGNEISVSPVFPVTFSAGENVIAEENEDGLVRYIAGETGILDLKENSVSVLSRLHISGDVGPETGSVFFSRDVVIDGNIQPLYRIRCGGDLTIKGQIENGADIECEGNFLAEKGIIGEKTRLTVKGNLETAFITETRLRVGGNMVVHGTVYSSEIFCGGSLTVEGQKMKSKNRGCIVGSRVASMKNMKLHSAGSGVSRTELICGIDNELKLKQEELKKINPVLEKKILRLQHGLGIDLKQENLIEKLVKLPPERKKLVKKKLEEIKGFALQKHEIEDKIARMDELIRNPDVENLSIKISSHLLPDTIVYIGDKVLPVKKDYGPSCIHLSEDRIVIGSL